MTRSSVKLTPVATKAAIYEKSDTELMTSQAHGTLDPSGSLINLRWLSKKNIKCFCSDFSVPFVMERERDRHTNLCHT